jgi:hypothetical protein
MTTSLDNTKMFICIRIKKNLKLPVGRVTIREINQISDPRMKTKSVNATLGERAEQNVQVLSKAILVCVTNLEQVTAK